MEKMTVHSKLENNNFIKALLREPVDRTPIWMMRQAGRYLPEYRELRKKAGSFINLMKTPEYATEATLQPLRRFDLDAAIVFSDILTIPDAMGLGLYFVEGEGPKFKNPIRNAESIKRLSVPSDDSLSFVYQTIRDCRREINGKVPLIGFSGSPWTLACYMVEGSGSKDFNTIKKMLYKEPKLLHSLLKIISESVVQYLNNQIEAGVQAVMIFDTWGGLLTHPAYKAFSLEYISYIVDNLKKTHDGERIPSIVFTKGSGQWLEDIAKCGANAVGLDWMTNLDEAFNRVGDKVALQGNLDPAVLLASDNEIIAETERVLKLRGQPKDNQGYVFNLGHGISKETNPDAVTTLIKTVHQFQFAK